MLAVGAGVFVFHCISMWRSALNRIQLIRKESCFVRIVSRVAIVGHVGPTSDKANRKVNKGFLCHYFIVTTSQALKTKGKSVDLL